MIESVVTKEDISTREIKNRIALQAPYFSLSHIMLEGDFLKTSFDLEQLSIPSSSPFTLAEISKHLSTLGASALAQASEKQGINFYLITSAHYILRTTFLENSNISQFYAKAGGNFVNDHSARAEATLVDVQNRTLVDGTIHYSVIPKNVFEMSYKQFYHQLPPSESSLKRQPYLICKDPVMAGKSRIAAVVDKIEAPWCAGHFPNYPVLPLSTMLFNYEYLTSELLKHTLKNRMLDFHFTNTIINSYFPAFHGGKLIFDIELISKIKNRYYFFGKVIYDSNLLISTVNLTATLVR